MTFEPHFTVTHRITADLTRIERARGFLGATTLSEDWIRRMGARALVLEVHHTTHIEGTKRTLDESERLLAGNAVPGTDPENVRELPNHRDAFEFVSAWLGCGGPITEGLVREIHKRLVDGVRGGAAAPGEYRRCSPGSASRSVLDSGWVRRVPVAASEGEPPRQIQRGTTGRHPA